MATISNPTLNKKEDEDKEFTPTQIGGPQSSNITPQTGTQGGQQSPQQTSAAQGVNQSKTPASGRFTNINTYMGANKQAGSQLGQALGQNIQGQIGKSTTEAQKAQSGLQNTIGQAGQQQQKIQDYTTNLSQSSTPQANQQGLLSTQTGPGYLASGYEANLGERANYAQTLANDEKALNDFLKYRSGQVAQQEQSKLDKSKSSAETSTQKAQDTFAQKSDQISRDRKTLLSDLIKSPNYNTGKQSLDQAFLQMDKGDTLGNVRRDIAQQQSQFNKNNLFPQLSQQYGTQREALDTATTGLQDQTNKNLSDLYADIDSRQQTMNEARVARQKQLEDEFANLQNNKGISKEFADSLGLTQGQGLWNTLDNLPSLANIMDMSGIQQMAGSRGDLSNQRDVDLSSAFAKLAQTNPSITEASKLAGEGKVSDEFTNRLAEQQKAYDDLVKTYRSGGGANQASAGGFGSMNPEYRMNNVDVSALMDRATQAGLTNEDLQKYMGITNANQFSQLTSQDPKFQQFLNTYKDYNYGSQQAPMTYDQWNNVNNPIGFNTSPGGTLGQFINNPDVLRQQYNQYVNQHNNAYDQRNKDTFATTFQDILKDLAGQGYFNRVNINPEGA